MSDGWAVELQRAVRSRLIASGGVSAIVGDRIYGSYIPQQATKPLLRFLDFAPVTFDTDTTNGMLVTFSLEAISDKVGGPSEAQKISYELQRALHRQEEHISLNGFSLVELIFLTSVQEEQTTAGGWVVSSVFQAMLEAEN